MLMRDFALAINQQLGMISLLQGMNGNPIVWQMIGLIAAFYFLFHKNQGAKLVL